MAESVASSTAVLVCQGRAAADGRYAVEQLSDPVAWLLLEPGERAVVEQARAGQPPPDGATRMSYELVRRLLRVALRPTRQADPLAAEPWRSTLSPEATANHVVRQWFRHHLG